MAGVGMCLVATGCYDFLGDWGKLGFQSNLTMGGGVPWTPAHGVADGTDARFRISHVVAEEEVDPAELDVQPSVRGGLELVEAGAHTVVVRGDGRRGRVRFSGEADDGFSVGFRRPEQMGLLVPAHGIDRQLEPFDEVGVVMNEPCSLGVSIRDRRGRELGYDPSLLAVWSDGDGEVYAEDGGGVSVRLGPQSDGLVGSYGGTLLEGAQVHGVAVDEVVEISLLLAEADSGEDERVWVGHAMGWTESGLPVACLPVEFDLPMGVEAEVDGSHLVVLADAVAPEEITVLLGAHRATGVLVPE